MLKQKINLRMANQDATPIVALVQNDTGREIECGVLQSNLSFLEHKSQVCFITHFLITKKKGEKHMEIRARP